MERERLLFFALRFFMLVWCFDCLPFGSESNICSTAENCVRSHAMGAKLINFIASESRPNVARSFPLFLKPIRPS